MESGYGDPHSIYLIQGDRVIIETENGLESALVTDKEKMIEHPKGNVYRILRKCTPKDVERIAQNRDKEKEAYHLSSNKIEQKKLTMTLTAVEFTFERTKLFVYYTAEGRVDFRELLKELGHLLHTKIQMVQIGVRDEAKMLGGYGPCGRASCCSTFLREFKPVVIEMAKDQGLALNPTKISGLCGRLICCLGYEHNFYRDMCRTMPKLGGKITTKDGIGVVKNINIFKEEVEVIFDDGSAKKYPISEFSQCDMNCGNPSTNTPNDKKDERRRSPRNPHQNQNQNNSRPQNPRRH